MELRIKAVSDAAKCRFTSYRGEHRPPRSGPVAVQAKKNQSWNISLSKLHPALIMQLLLLFDYCYYSSLPLPLLLLDGDTVSHLTKNGAGVPELGSSAAYSPIARPTQCQAELLSQAPVSRRAESDRRPIR
jgi:hypothetical protein